MWCCRLDELTATLQAQGLIQPTDDAGELSRVQLLERRLEHLESVIEGHVAHIAALRESVQRVAGGCPSALVGSYSAPWLSPFQAPL